MAVRPRRQKRTAGQAAGCCRAAATQIAALTGQHRHSHTQKCIPTTGSFHSAPAWVARHAQEGGRGKDDGAVGQVGVRQAEALLQGGQTGGRACSQMHNTRSNGRHAPNEGLGLPIRSKHSSRAWQTTLQAAQPSAAAYGAAAAAQHTHTCSNTQQARQQLLRSTQQAGQGSAHLHFGQGREHGGRHALQHRTLGGVVCGCELLHVRLCRQSRQGKEGV